jgi:glycosyltransferase involved in cell wall biosynthesis
MKNINLNCPINGTGYGITSWNITKALHKQGINISLFPIGSKIEIDSENEHELIKTLLNNNNSFAYNAPCLKIWHQHDLASKIGNGHYYTFPFFEVDTLTPREIHHLNYSDYIFVASKWAKNVLLNNGINKSIFVAPLGVDTEIFKDPIKIKTQNDHYIFFHVGKWEQRKSQDFLLKAFDAAFTEFDKVELRLLPHNPFLNENETNYWLKLVENCKLKDKIKLYNRLPTQYHLAEFIYHADCGVFLSRAEGWNNEVIETMAMNKPVIVTNYSAHTEYCNSDNSFLVNIEDLEEANDGKWFNGIGKWAKLDNNQLEQTVHYLRYVYTNRIESNPIGLNTAKYYSWKHTTDIILETLLRNNSYHANTKTKSRRK